MKISNLFNAIVSALFPNTCACCKDIIDEGEYLCNYCFSMAERCDNDKLCQKCGTVKTECECKYRAFSFDRIIAAFYSDRISRKAMYEFKFRKAEPLARFFAERMALVIRQFYKDINFDFVCCVPMTKREELRRGYNQSALLAREISEIFGIPFYENALYCTEKEHPQHSLSPKERIHNVKDVYYTNQIFSGKKILLVDDIKTTGSTLNECAKCLVDSLADGVYCVVAITTKNKKGKANGNRDRNRFRNLKNGYFFKLKSSSRTAQHSNGRQ